MRAWRRFVLVAVALALGTARCRADGFESRFFKTYFDAAWEELQPRMARDAGFRRKVIVELVQILYFFDGYTSRPAEDSPFWTKSEDGRAYAREAAAELLARLGAESAPVLWELLKSDLRFETPQRRARLTRIEAAKAERTRAENAAFAELPRFPALNAQWAAIPEDQRSLSLLRAFVRTYPGARGDAALAGHLEAAERAETERLAAVRDYNEKLALPFLRGQLGPSPGAVFADLEPSATFRESLEAALQRIGGPAAVLVRNDLASPSAAVRDAARRLLPELEAKEKARQAFAARDLFVIQPKRWRLARLAEWLKQWKDEAQRAETEARLKKHGERLVPDLLELLGDPERGQKAQAAAALKLLTGQGFGGDLAAWQQWWAKRNAPAANVEAQAAAIDGMDLEIVPRKEAGAAPKPAPQTEEDALM